MRGVRNGRTMDVCGASHGELDSALPRRRVLRPSENSSSESTGYELS
jgi:hypothetical protein